MEVCALLILAAKSGHPTADVPRYTHSSGDACGGFDFEEATQLSSMRSMKSDHDC